MADYKDWIIQHNPKPIPIRTHDWDAFHEDYDGAIDSGDTRSFTAPTKSEAKALILEWIRENESGQFEE